MTTKLNTNQLGSDQTVFNEGNLIGSSNIDLGVQLNPYYIDDYTYLVFSGEDDFTATGGMVSTAKGATPVNGTTNSYSSQSLSDSKASMTNGAKFGDKCYYSTGSGYISAPLSLVLTNDAVMRVDPTTNDVTIDTWYYRESNWLGAEYYFNFGGHGASLIYSGGVKKIQTTFGGVTNTYPETKINWANLPAKWSHFAATYNHNTSSVYMYFDGTFLGSFPVTFTTDYFDLTGSVFKGGGWGWKVDELRISFADRYHGKDYDVPTAPYRISAESGKYCIDLSPAAEAKLAAIDAKQNSSTAVTHTESTAVGSATQPVYVDSNGTATATTYALNATVPADAVFTDTTYAAGDGITITGTTIAAKAPQAAIMTGYTGVTGSTLTSTASGTITRVYKNGALLTVTTDYTVSGNVITFTTALESADRVSVETEGGITKIIQIAQSDYDALETASALDANAFYLVVADPVVAE